MVLNCFVRAKRIVLCVMKVGLNKHYLFFSSIQLCTFIFTVSFTIKGITKSFKQTWFGRFLLFPVTDRTRAAQMAHFDVCNPTTSVFVSARRFDFAFRRTRVYPAKIGLLSFGILFYIRSLSLPHTSFTRVINLLYP